jgi:hypothetical protein
VIGTVPNPDADVILREHETRCRRILDDSNDGKEACSKGCATRPAIAEAIHCHLVDPFLLDPAQEEI